jgi:hypothetical protein
MDYFAEIVNCKIDFFVVSCVFNNNPLLVSGANDAAEFLHEICTANSTDIAQPRSALSLKPPNYWPAVPLMGIIRKRSDPEPVF